MVNRAKMDQWDQQEASLNGFGKKILVSQLVHQAAKMARLPFPMLFRVSSIWHVDFETTPGNNKKLGVKGMYKFG